MGIMQVLYPQVVSNNKMHLFSEFVIFPLKIFFIENTETYGLIIVEICIVHTLTFHYGLVVFFFFLSLNFFLGDYNLSKSN